MGRAAIQAGADAIYIGAPRFGAREKAGNSIDDIATLVREADEYGVQVLVTLNTLLSESERQEAIAIAETLWQKGVYAFIVQDLALAEALIGRGIRVHASTQCDNRTIEDVRARRAMGFSRVVLARELSIDEIRAIHEAVPDIELEAFVHGALCVSYSGRCYMSEVLMGRSANRGACAQMCRMRYDVLDAEGREVLDDAGQPLHQRHVLSLQDMDRSRYLSELIDAGVTTFKIEGRLKDADYVTNITAYYRQLMSRVESLECNVQSAKCIVHSSKDSIYHYDFVPNPEKTFHRGGIDYMLHGRTPHMANFDTPKSTGEAIGVTKTNTSTKTKNNTITIALYPGVVLHNGDGISVGNQGANINGVEGDRILLSSPVQAAAGTVVYRNLDVDFARHLHAERRIPVDIVLSEIENGYRLRIGDREQDFEAEHIAARDPEKAMQTARTQLSKLGDTIYIARGVTVKTTNFIPIGTLNEWRRMLLTY